MLADNQIVMEYAVVRRDQVDRPHLKSFRRLWPGHYGKVQAGSDIYLSQFANGGGGAVKYTKKGMKELNGEELVVYEHCHKRFPDVVILVHPFRPKVVVKHEMCFRDDGLAVAVTWFFAASSERITDKFYYISVP